MRLEKRWWLVLVLLGAIALFYAFGLGRFLSLEAIKSSQADVEVWRASRPLLAALLFFAIDISGRSKGAKRLWNVRSMEGLAGTVSTPQKAPVCRSETI